MQRIMSIFLTKVRRNWAVLWQTKNFKHTLSEMPDNSALIGAFEIDFIQKCGGQNQIRSCKSKKSRKNLA
jgi:hypothetical protein